MVNNFLYKVFIGQHVKGQMEETEIWHCIKEKKNDFYMYYAVLLLLTLKKTHLKLKKKTNTGYGWQILIILWGMVWYFMVCRLGDGKVGFQLERDELFMNIAGGNGMEIVDCSIV